jgi:2-phosphosulfolactate phosphatase
MSSTLASRFDQRAFDVRCEWGVHGVEALADCRTFIVVDVLSFSTCVAMCCERGVETIPCLDGDPRAAALAQARGAELAGRRGDRYSLSPASLMALPTGARIVLPSLNGAAVALHAARHGHVLAGSLRNRMATCARAVALRGPFAVIAAGERWPDGSLRPAFEDLVAAGAIAAMLPGTHSPEVTAAIAAFAKAAPDLHAALLACGSGAELVERGFAGDVELAAQLDTCVAAPELVDGAFVQLSQGSAA